MTILVNVTTKGVGGSKIPKKLTTWFMDDPLWNVDLHCPQCLWNPQTLNLNLIELNLTLKNETRGFYHKF